MYASPKTNQVISLNTAYIDIIYWGFYHMVITLT
jgi:hypothetical protein